MKRVQYFGVHFSFDESFIKGKNNYNCTSSAAMWNIALYFAKFVLYLCLFAHL